MGCYGMTIDDALLLADFDRITETIRSGRSHIVRYDRPENALLIVDLRRVERECCALRERLERRLNG
jgi:hypothetical protein